MRNRGIELCILDTPETAQTQSPASADDARVVSAAGVPGRALPEALVKCHHQLAASCSAASRQENLHMPATVCFGHLVVANLGLCHLV